MPYKGTEDVAAEICTRISEGESIRAIHRSPRSTNFPPTLSSIFQWLNSDPVFAEQYTRAREAQADVLADQIVEIADEEHPDSSRQRLRVEARKWTASKLRPKRYGDKLDVGHTGHDGGAVKVEVSVRFV